MNDSEVSIEESGRHMGKGQLDKPAGDPPPPLRPRPANVPTAPLPGTPTPELADGDDAPSGS